MKQGKERFISLQEKTRNLVFVKLFSYIEQQYGKHDSIYKWPEARSPQGERSQFAPSNGPRVTLNEECNVVGYAIDQRQRKDCSYTVNVFCNQ